MLVSYVLGSAWVEVGYDLQLEHQIARSDGDDEELISCESKLPPFFLGNRFPRLEQENVNVDCQHDAFERNAVCMAVVTPSLLMPPSQCDLAQRPWGFQLTCRSSS